MVTKKIIRTRAPLRISFVGGGTDLNEVFEKYGGAVISTTIDKYVYVELSKGKGVTVNGEKPDCFTQQIIDKLKINNIKINTWYEVPFGRGLANSSAYSVALTKAILLYKGSHRSKREIVKLVYGIENSLGKCGWQDQIACVYGGMNRIAFGKQGFCLMRCDTNDKIKKELEKRLCLVYTGLTHKSSATQSKRKPISEKKANKLKELVNNTYGSLIYENLKNIPVYLNHGWRLKKDKAIVNKQIERLYKKGFTCGASGGKLLGAGDGGYILFYVEPNNMLKFREKMSITNQILNLKFTEKGVEQW